MESKIEHIIRRKAQLDIKDAYQWYEEQRKGLGELFLKDLNNCISSIIENPDS